MNSGQLLRAVLLRLRTLTARRWSRTSLRSRAMPRACLSSSLPGPLPSSAADSQSPPPTPQWADVVVFCVARPARPPPGDPPVTLASTRPGPCSLHIRLQHSFSPQMRCDVLRGAAKALTLARSRQRASAPSPSCQEPRQGPSSVIAEPRGAGLEAAKHHGGGGTDHAQTRAPGPPFPCAASAPLSLCTTLARWGGYVCAS